MTRLHSNERSFKEVFRAHKIFDIISLHICFMRVMRCPKTFALGGTNSKDCVRLTLFLLYFHGNFIDVAAWRAGEPKRRRRRMQPEPPLPNSLGSVRTTYRTMRTTEKVNYSHF